MGGSGNWRRSARRPAEPPAPPCAPQPRSAAATPPPPPRARARPPVPRRPARHALASPPGPPGPRPAARVRAPAVQVRREDLVDVGHGAVVVPDALRKDHHGRHKLAAGEAAGGIDARVGEAELLRARLHVIAQLLAALLAAATLGMPGRPRVG